MEKIRGSLLAGAVIAGLGYTGSAMAASIGVNFIGGNNGGGASVTGTAGAVPKGNWNNEANNTGTGAALTLDSGAASGASLSWNSPNVWASGQAGANQNGVLMQGYLDNSPGNPSSATVTGLPS